MTLFTSVIIVNMVNKRTKIPVLRNDIVENDAI